MPPARIVLPLLLLLGLPPGAPVAAQPPAYDTSHLLEALSSSWRGQAPRRLGVSDLADLPLYQLELDFNPLTARLRVEQTINLKNRSGRPLGRLVFHAGANAGAGGSPQDRPLVLDEASVAGRPVAPRWLGPTVFALEVAPPLQPGRRLLVRISARLRLPRLPAAAAVDASAMLGLPAHGYGVCGHRDGVYNLARFYPLLAARRAGRWDTTAPAALGDGVFAEPANYLVRLRLPRQLRVASGALLAGRKPAGLDPAGEQLLFLVGCALRELALQISSRYLVRRRESNGVRLRAFVLDGDERLAERLLDEAQAALRYFSGQLGPYPFAKLDLAVAPLLGGAGGMEFPGLITVAESVLRPPAGGPLGALLGRLLDNSAMPGFVTAHEVAHQWFYAQVGSHPVLHPVLDEGLANYLAVLFFESRHGAQAAAGQLELQLLAPYRLWRALGGRDGRVLRPAGSFRSQLEYVALVYGKGALFYHALRRRLGKQRLLGCLRRYVRERAFRTATPEQLLKTLARCSGRPRVVERLWRRWLLEAHADADLQALGLAGTLPDLLGKLPALGGLPNVKLDGALDPAILRLWQQAVRQLTGGP